MLGALLLYSITLPLLSPYTCHHDCIFFCQAGDGGLLVARGRYKCGRCGQLKVSKSDYLERDAYGSYFYLISFTALHSASQDLIATLTPAHVYLPHLRADKSCLRILRRYVCMLHRHSNSHGDHRSRHSDALGRGALHSSRVEESGVPNTSTTSTSQSACSKNVTA